MKAFDYEEILQHHRSSAAKKHKTHVVKSRMQTMRNVRKTGAFFYFSALGRTTGLFNI